MNLEPLIAAVIADAMPLVRTDFSDDAGWRRIVTAVSRTVDFTNPANPHPGDYGYTPNIVPIDDSTFEGTTGEALSVEWPQVGVVGYVLLADRQSMNDDRDPSVAFVDLSVSDPEYAEFSQSFMGRTFRCASSEIAAIDANLSISNMDFHEFADGVGVDGVFRGFAK